MFVTKDVAQAQEAANVMDFYQNLVRDLQVAVRKAVGPIKDTGQGEGFTKKLEEFAKDLDKHVEGFGDPSELGLKGAAADKAQAIMDAKHPTPEATAAAAPANAEAVKKAEEAKQKQAAQSPQPHGGNK